MATLGALILIAWAYALWLLWSWWQNWKKYYQDLEIYGVYLDAGQRCSRPAPPQSPYRKVLAALVASLVLMFAGGPFVKAYEKAAISRVLVADARAGDPPVRLVDIPGRLRRIDLRGCPVKFRDLYEQHVRAWEDAEQALRDYDVVSEKNNSAMGLLSAFANGFTGNIFGVAGSVAESIDVSQQVKKYGVRIESTFEMVKAYAREEGIDVDKLRGR